MNRSRTENIVDGEITLAKLDTTGATAGQTLVMGASTLAWGTAGTATTAAGLASGDGTLSFSADTWTFTGDAIAEVRADYYYGAFIGDGSQITGIADSALSANVALKDGDNTFTGNNSFTGGLTFTGLAIASGKTLTVSKTMTLTSSDDTSVITLPAGTKTLASTDGSVAGLASGSSTFTYDADDGNWITADVVKASAFNGSAEFLTGIVDSALSSNVPLLNAANEFTAANTFTTTTGVAITGTSLDYIFGVGVAGVGLDYGVTGEGGIGVLGTGTDIGVCGGGTNTGVYGFSDIVGVAGLSLSGIGVSGTGTVSATLLGDLSANTGTNTAWADSDNTKLWWAQKFTAGATETATAVSLKLAKGSATAPTLASSTITAYIHADSTGAVGSVLTGGTGTAIRFDALTSTTPAEFYFGGMSAALTSGTAYWIVVKASAFETSAGSIVHDSKSATAGTYGTYNTGTSTWDYTAELAAWCKVHSAGGVGISGTSTIGDGVVGTSTTGYGGSFTSTRSRGVYGLGQTYGVYGETQTTVVGTNYGIYGMAANSSGYGVGGTGSYGGGQFTGVTRGIDVTQTTGRSVITQTAASSTNEALLITRTSASNGTGPILLLNNAGSAVSGNLITAQTGGVDKFSVGVEGNIITAGTIAATGAITSNSFPVSLWRGASGTEPSTGLADGQLYFNTTQNMLYVYYSSAWHVTYTAP